MPTQIRPAPTGDGAPAIRISGSLRARLSSPPMVGLLATMTLIAAVAVVILSVLTRSQPGDGLLANLPWVMTSLVFAAVGTLVAIRQPHSPIGWIVLAVGLGLLLSSVGSTYSVIDFRIHHGELPLGLLAVWLADLWFPSILLTGLLLLLFPAGSLPSPRWRWPLRLFLTAWCLSLIATFVVAAGTPIVIDSNGDQVINNHGGFLAALNSVPNLLGLVVGALWLAFLARLLVSYRRTEGDRRQQLKWLMGGGAIGFGSLILLVSGVWGSSAGPPNPLVAVAFYVCCLGIGALPVAFGVGILKYRLYDIDRIISRTLSYAIVTGLLVGVYVGLVTLATKVLPFSSPLGVAASTLVAVALFNPLRRRVQKLVDRRFNRARYDAESTVAAFALRLRDDVDLDAVSSEFVRAVEASVEPAHVSLWLRPTGATE